MLTKILLRTFAEHWARTTQTPPTKTSICPSHVGNSRSLETLADNHFTHHRNHQPDAPKEVGTVEVEGGEEAEEEDYLPQLDQDYSLHMDKLLTLTSF
jgi:hypothetical protein